MERGKPIKKFRSAVPEFQPKYKILKFINKLNAFCVTCIMLILEEFKNMYIDFSAPLTQYNLENGNILNEYQIGETLIYIEFHADNQFLEFHQNIKKNYLSDYKNISKINEFSHNLFLIKNMKYKDIFENIDKKITCLKVYSFRYFMDKDYIQYDCFINHDFIELIEGNLLYEDLYETLDNTQIYLKFKDEIITESTNSSI